MTSTSTKVLLLGGSTINGLGHDGVPFGRLVAERLHAEVLDLTEVSQTCRDMLDRHATAIETYAPDLAVLMVAGTESLMRPGHRVQHLIERFAPPNWHGVAGLEPRARYSRSRARRVRQQVESRLKVLVKNVLFKALGGGRPRVEFCTLAADASELIGFVSARSARVVLVGLPTVDSRLFPGTKDSFARTNALVRALADAYPNATYVSLDGSLEQWHDYLADHFHLSGDGHERVAALVTERIAA